MRLGEVAERWPSPGGTGPRRRRGCRCPRAGRRRGSAGPTRRPHISSPKSLDDPLRGVVVGPGHDAAEHAPIGVREVLAAEILQDPALDPRVVASGGRAGRGPGRGRCLLNRSSMTIWSARASTSCARHVVIEVALADLVEPAGRRRSGLSARAVESRISPEVFAVGLVVGLVERVDQVVQDVAAVMVWWPRSSACSRNSPGPCEWAQLRKARIRWVLPLPASPRSSRIRPDGSPGGVGRAVHQALEGGAGLLVDRLHVERVLLPDVVAVGDRVEDLRPVGGAERSNSRVVGTFLGGDAGRYGGGRASHLGHQKVLSGRRTKWKVAL